MKKIRLFISVAILLVVCTQSSAKPRIISFQTELNNAHFVRFVEVITYTDSSMITRHIATGDTIRFMCKGKRTADNMRMIMKPDSQVMEGYWPKPGDQVLILADTNYSIHLLAFKINKDYQFWNPNMDLLGSWFSFSQPARPTQYCMDQSEYPAYQDKDCFDGCLYTIDLIKER